MLFIYLGHRNVTEGVPKEGDINPEQSGVTAIRDKKKKNQHAPVRATDLFKKGDKHSKENMDGLEGKTFIGKK